MSVTYPLQRLPDFASHTNRVPFSPYKYETSLPLIEHGILQHFEEDYVSAIHILMPQVEATLRALIFAKGIIPLKLEKKKDKEALINEGELGALLNRREVQNLLGRDFVEYLKVKLVEQTGINFRNDVSHGLVDSIEEFNPTSSYSLIHVILLLITI